MKKTESFKLSELSNALRFFSRESFDTTDAKKQILQKEYEVILKWIKFKTTHWLQSSIPNMKVVECF